jgi:acyl-CoA thioester hydrolase
LAKSDFNFSHRLRVRYSEIDGQGIVFNSHYLTYFDTAIYAYLRSLPFDYRAHPKKSGQDFHTVKVSLEFKESARFDEEIDVFTRVGKVGRSSLTFEMEIYRAGQEDLLVYGSLIWVNTDQAERKSVPLPPDLVKRIQRREAAPA